MYELTKDLLYKEHKIDVTLNKHYNDFFEVNFRETFRKIDTEDIKDLNKHLLDTQISFFNDNVLPRQRKIEPVSNVKDNTDNTEKTEETEPDDNNIIIESLKRVIHLTDSSRFNYKMNQNLDNTQVSVEKVIMPIESNPLFAGPFLMMSLNDVQVNLHLRGTIQMSKREFGIYSPYH